MGLLQENRLNNRPTLNDQCLLLVQVKCWQGHRYSSPFLLPVVSDKEPCKITHLQLHKGIVTLSVAIRNFVKQNIKVHVSVDYEKWKWNV